MTKLLTTEEPLKRFRKWVLNVVDKCQHFSGETNFDSAANLQDAVERFLDGIPDPRTPAERFALRSLSLELALKAGSLLHSRFHLNRLSQCFFDPSKIAVAAWGVENNPLKTDPKVLFRKWAQDFVSGFEKEHRVAEELRKRVVMNFDKRLTLRSLSSDLNRSESNIRQTFRRNFSMTVREYQRYVRVSRAVVLLKNREKVEFVADHVGYRSRKNFNNALKALTALTPTKVRDLEYTPFIAGSDLADPSSRASLGGARRIGHLTGLALRD